MTRRGARNRTPRALLRHLGRAPRRRNKMELEMRLVLTSRRTSILGLGPLLILLRSLTRCSGSIT